jgi:hypothetical protein
MRGLVLGRLQGFLDNAFYDLRFHDPRTHDSRVYVNPTYDNPSHDNPTHDNPTHDVEDTFVRGGYKYQTLPKLIFKINFKKYQDLIIAF